jgi:divalent metal cation (Fe/Co/Zn/Cd) transporter
MAGVAALERTTALLRGRRLKYCTIVWNCVEGVVAEIACLVASSISLVGFGIDSFIEVTSGSILLWRISVDADARGRERNEQRAPRVVGICFVALSGYVGYESLADLWSKRAPEHSVAGITLACVSLVVMPAALSSEA